MSTTIFPIEAPSGDQAIVVCVLSGLSAVACLLVAILMSCMPILRQPPGRFVRSRSVYELWNSLFIFGYGLWAVVPEGARRPQLRHLLHQPLAAHLRLHASPGLERARQRAREGTCMAQLGGTRLSLFDVFMTLVRF